VIEMHRAGRTALRRAGEITVPLLVVQGEADPVVPPASTRDFFALVASPDKELVVLPGFRHEPHHELGKEDVIGRVVDWVARH
jgi:alpha-beta hydrolase superfamily lysophospholipase